MLYLVLGILVCLNIVVCVIYYNLVKAVREREEYEKEVYIEEFLMQEKLDYERERKYRDD